MNTKMQKMAIRIFKLKNFEATLLEAKRQQQKDDQKYWSSILEEREQYLNDRHHLEILELKAQIEILKDERRQIQKRVKALNRKEQFLKIQAKENSIISTHITNKTHALGHEIVKITEEMSGIKKDAEAMEQLLLKYKE